MQSFQDMREKDLYSIILAKEIIKIFHGFSPTIMNVFFQNKRKTTITLETSSLFTIIAKEM